MKWLRALLPAAILCSGSPWAAAQIAPVAVEVVSNYFDPARISIQPGDAVRWTARNAGHAVVADDGRFRFPASGTMAAGDAFTFTFAGDEWVRYHCAVHAEMRGTIKVGDPPAPPVDEPSEIRVVPSAQFPTIEAALTGIPSGAAVDLAPGTYAASLVAGIDGLRIRGTGSVPGDVVLDGGGIRSTGIAVRASGVRIQNLTISSFTASGIAVEDADHAIVEHVAVAASLPSGGRTTAGIRVRRSRFVRIADTDISGARSGIDIEDCAPCDVLVDGSVLHNGVAGLRARNASSLIVRGSTVRDNAFGLAITRTDPATLHGGLDIIDNTVANNVAPKTFRATDPVASAPGVGIWIDGLDGGRIIGNRIQGQRYGISITGIGGPSYGHTIVANDIEGSTRAALAWDGIGANLCFESNTGDGATEPVLIQAIYPCDGTPRPGLPFPVVATATVGLTS